MVKMKNEHQGKFGYFERLAISTGVIAIVLFFAALFNPPAICPTLPWTWACLLSDRLGVSNHLPNLGLTAYTIIFIAGTFISLLLAAIRGSTSVGIVIWMLLNIAWGWMLWKSLDGFGLGI